MLNWLRNIWARLITRRRIEDPVVEAPVVVSLPAPSQSAEPEAKERKPSSAPLRNAVEARVTDLIERIASLDMSNMVDHEGGRQYEEGLSDIFGCDFHDLSELSLKMEGGSRWFFNWHDERDTSDIHELSWPVDIATVAENERGLFFVRLWTAKPEEMRGRVKIFAPQSAWLVNLSFEKRNDHDFWCEKVPIGFINGRWRALNDGMKRLAREAAKGTLHEYTISSPQLREEIHNTAMCLQSAALTERYSWHVALGQANGPRILLPTNPKGCLDLFKTREKRTDETRRAALRHWVSNHYREHGDREIAYVRDHLRGATEFNWRDLDCEIFVSAFDLEKNEFFRQQANEWRSQRKHNRVRVRLKSRAS